MLKKVGERGTVKIDKAKDPKAHKKSEKPEMENKWKEKQMHGQYVRDMKGIDWGKTWLWLQKGDPEGCTEALICSAQEQALRTTGNYIQFHIDENSESDMCRMCREKVT